MPLSVNNLVGFGAKRPAAGGGGAPLTFIGETTNSSSGYSVSFHGSAATGDLAIVGECFDSTTALAGTTEAAPSGWTLFDDTLDTSSNHRSARDNQVGFYYKVLTSGDISGGSVSSAITGDADVTQQMACQIWRPSSTPSLSVQLVLAGNGAALSITASSGSAPVIVVGAVCGDFGGSNTPAFDQVTTVGSDLALGVTFYESSPVDHTVDDDAGGVELNNVAGYANVTFA